MPQSSEPDKGPELFFGLIGAVGSDLDKTLQKLKSELRSIGYIPEEIRLSRLMAKLKGFENLEDLRDGPEDERIDQHMEAGNKIRQNVQSGDALVRVGMSRIHQIRIEKSKINQKNGEKEFPPLQRHAYIFNSLKHPEEVNTLRRVYGDGVFFISTYEPRESRSRRLVKRISQSRKKKISRRLTKSESDEYEKKAEYLIEEDEKELGNILGQNVRDTFPIADLFVADIQNSSAKFSLEEQIRRFIRLIFGARFLTPTVDEYGIFHATAAALRSADLSRQVGAVIITNDGEIVSAGCNEVPKSKGGSVWAGLTPTDKDYRDYKLGYDAAAQMKHEIILEIFDKLMNAKWISERDELKEKTAEDLASDALYGNEKANPPIPPTLKDTRVASILEFGRIVHAEMSAITDAARRGISVRDATLYSTTFPCHMCARHILASGIKRVVYVEPYPKSLAKELYEKSIRVDGDSKADSDAVAFEPFVGISPRKYLRLFEMLDRKDNRGYALKEDHIDREPRMKPEFSVYPDVEKVYTASLEKHDLVVPANHGGVYGGEELAAKSGEPSKE